MHVHVHVHVHVHAHANANANAATPQPGNDNNDNDNARQTKHVAFHCSVKHQDLAPSERFTCFVVSSHGEYVVYRAFVKAERWSTCCRMEHGFVPAGPMDSVLERLYEKESMVRSLGRGGRPSRNQSHVDRRGGNDDAHAHTHVERRNAYAALIIRDDGQCHARVIMTTPRCCIVQRLLQACARQLLSGSTCSRLSSGRSSGAEDELFAAGVETKDELFVGAGGGAGGGARHELDLQRKLLVALRSVSV